MANLSKTTVGVDIIEIERIEQAVSAWQGSFLKRIYTEAELESCHSVIPSLAARFAAKEATMKALGINSRGLNWRDIEVLSNNNGAPLVQLHGRAYKKAEELGVTGISVSMSHSKQYAVAFVISDAI
ncbi:MAG: holo-ACP synthase [Chloroflexota bacterium]|nr:holo-ACP synthase [Chloroflexota bacterium]